jgi:hypothetical protein
MTETGRIQELEADVAAQHRSDTSTKTAKKGLLSLVGGHLSDSLGQF